ncbi:hypothetical protein KFE25_005582 [Diacronema lutheri]|uniref:WKF domain-containing protein n=1 Tax=Diacronema lutheri TaxID=2081491 RepID=A0A8J6C914_DIALT|nr:hypothetical protein KFE25_005582 [Diacronema lutheri]
MKRKKGERLKKKHFKRPAPKRPSNGTAPNPAVDAIRYLDEWCAQAKGGAWKFAKSRQVYLLRHAFNADVLPEQHFKKLVSYLVGLPEGAARAKTIEQARAHADGRLPQQPKAKDVSNAAAPAAEPSSGEEPTASAAKDVERERAQLVQKRARRILKALGAAAAS